MHKGTLVHLHNGMLLSNKNKCILVHRAVKMTLRYIMMAATRLQGFIL